MNKMSLNT